MKKFAPQQGEATFKMLSSIGKSLSRGTSHMKAMNKQPGLGGLLKHGLKAAKELQTAARKLSKFSPGSVRRIEGKSSEGGGRAIAVQPKGVKLMVGRPQKNWEEATAEHGYRELKPKGDEGLGISGKRLRVMLGPIHRNWEHTTAESGFTELKGRSGGGGESGSRLRIMVGKPRLNWEEVLEPFAPRGDGAPRANIVASGPSPEKAKVRFGSGGAQPAKPGRASLSDLVKVARRAHPLSKELKKSHG